MKKLICAAAILTTVAIGLAGCGQTASSAPTTKIVAVGSTALQPLVEQAAKQYQQKHGATNITVQGGGSGAGLTQVADGAVTIGNSDIFATEQPGIKSNKLVDHQVAVVGIAPIVNQDAGVTNLTSAQLRQIFTGKITNWRAVGGNNRPIVLINRTQGSGTRRTFESLALKTTKVKTAQEQDSNGTVAKMVQTTPGAISYIAFSYLKKGVQAISLNGVKPTAANVITNNWPVWAYEHMYTKGAPNAATGKFIKYLQSATLQKTLITKMGYIPVTKMQVARTATGSIEEINR